MMVEPVHGSIKRQKRRRVAPMKIKDDGHHFTERRYSTTGGLSDTEIQTEIIDTTE